MANWVTVQPGLPDVYSNIADTINSLVQALLAVLNVALAILNVIKAFLVGLLDPLVTLIEAVISEIESLINDIRNIGVYITSDQDLLEMPFENILGGFTAYERRMIGRLVDRTDPTRPNFSNRTAVIGIFLYASADTSGVERLVRLINQILLFFGQTGKASAFPAPIALEANYGTEGNSLGTYAPVSKAVLAEDTPDSVNISWQMPPPPGGASSKYATLMPKGFIIEVSTVRDGLVLTYDTSASSSQPRTNNRIYGLVRDPKTKLPFRLYGGKALIDVGDIEDGTYEDVDGVDSTTRMYFSKDATDNVPIDPAALEPQDGKAVLQAAFFVRAGVFNTIGPGSGYTATLSADQMPYDAEFEVDSNGKVVATLEPEPATTVYVRVSAVTSEYRDLIDITGKVTPIEGEGKNVWTTDSATTLATAQTQGQVFLDTANGLNTGSKSEPSLPLTVTFPGRRTRDYLDAVTAALAVLVLSRSDLAVTKSGNFEAGKAILATGIEDVARYLIPRILGKKVDKYYSREFISPEDFRSDLLKRCRRVATDLYQQTGPLGDVEETLVENSTDLLEFRWQQENPSLPNLTILESLDGSATEEGLAKYQGVGLNPYCIGIPGPALTNQFYRGGGAFSSHQVERFPSFDERGSLPFFLMGFGSQDRSPVIYDRSGVTGGTVAFCRNVFPPAVYDQAAAVLNVASGPLTIQNVPSGTGNWTALRLFPQGIPALDNALQEILGFVQALAAGLNSVVDVIVAYIEFLEARITELQALIVRINGLIQSLTLFDLPSASAVVVTGNGTQGVLSELVTAEDKPADSPLAYGAGVGILAGGLPAVLIEILQAFFPEE